MSEKILPFPKHEEEDLAVLMDRTARALLMQASDPVSDMPIADKVKVFDTAKDWLVAKLKVAPPKKPESKFADIQRRIQRGTSRGRGSGGDSEEE